jgi:tungstate transport system ATP-binding protein
MVFQPQVLLLDEPTANLDPYNVGAIEQTVRSLNASQGVTVILVTHNVFQAKRLAHRIALFLEGKVVEFADVQAFFDSPQDPRTSAFVRGEMVY